MMDRMSEELPPMQGFILPGGTRLLAQADRCRTITRRAERRVVTLARTATVDALVLEYLNRLSDFFFVFARYNNIHNQVEEIYWDKNA
jgi:cob(I)alamin adenosyltransferase